MDSRSPFDELGIGDRSPDLVGAGGPVFVIDTREWYPYRFSEEIAAVTATLKTGDYSLYGYEDQVCFERKSLSDFISSVTHERARFLREIERMQAIRFRGVVVEATLADIETHAYRSRAHPNSVLGNICSLSFTHGVPTYLWGPRASARNMLERALLKCWKILTSENKKDK